MGNTSLAVFALVMAVVCVGCSQPEAGTTANQTLKLYRDRLQSADREGFLACLTGNEQEMRLMSAYFDLNTAGYRFRDALIAGHGQAAWDRFQEEREGTYMRLSLTKFPADWLEKIQITVDGNRARALLPGGTKPLTMVRRDNHWFINASDFAPQPGRLAATIKMFSATARILQRFMAETRNANTNVDEMEKRMAFALIAELNIDPAATP